jgi:hypothetical protein
MEIVRQPTVAGLFYPADPQGLREQVREFLANVEQREVLPKAIVAPHAGYVYSGPIAGTAYAQIAPLADRVRRVVLLGPAHRMAFRGLAYSSAMRFRTPLGEVAVDRAALDALADLPQVHELDRPFDGEHCLEVQLPFLQTLLTDFKVVPLLVGEAEANSVAEVLERLWGGEETLIVISSDLSHYLDYATARAIDAATSSAIERLAPEAIGHHQACGRNPLNGLLVAAQRHGLHAVTLDVRNSGDTAGPRTQVVGYGAYVFS